MEKSFPFPLFHNRLRFLRFEGFQTDFTERLLHNRFMRGILLGNYPDLTGPGSIYVHNEEEMRALSAYAYTYSGYEELYGDEIEQDVQQAEQATGGTIAEDLYISRSRQKAIDYAYLYTWHDHRERNSEYPDFVNNDCTNFTSQALFAAGFTKIGIGDGCKQENSTSDWYVEHNLSPSVLCDDPYRNWEWSVSWSVPIAFRVHLASSRKFALVPGWTMSAETAKFHLSPGDFVQLQHQEHPGDPWETFHTMIVTSEDNNDIYVTYHSGEGDLDVVDKPLSAISIDLTRRFMLIKMLYPEVYLPILLNDGGEMYQESLGLPEESISTTGDLNLESINPYPSPQETMQGEFASPYPAP